MSEACIVRAMTDHDLPMVLAWRNHPAVRRYMLTKDEISLEEHRKWFARVKVDNTRQQLIVLDGTEPIGFVQLNPVAEGSTAKWGFYARPGGPKGSGTKIGKAALTHAFKTLGLYKVCGQAIESNKASIALHQKLGFAEEGLLQEQQRTGNQHHNLFCFGLLAKDWQESQLKQDRPNATY
jgi:UDP-4-amino-4,6-dideoxy-N-acetyl-beta-L-altrosamine N-acetyltransferase